MQSITIRLVPMKKVTPDPQATAVTRARYQRLAPFYDRMEALQEHRYRPWRACLWSLVQGPKVLEVGVGTGKNIPFYPPGLQITAVDLTPGMLERAERLAARRGTAVELRLGDAQALDFPDDTFDEAVATFVFCSVPDPVLGLQELARVVKPDGRLFLLEHVRSANAIMGVLMDLLNPVMVRLMGANINRPTVDHVRRAGWRLEQVDDLAAGGIFKLIVAFNDHQ
jgi:phosphatidylethanolamine/phosphatidyl-N-methylethanolamine N-methyltransferase